MDNLLGQISSKLASSSKNISLTINTKQVSTVLCLVCMVYNARPRFCC
jgi:hypothetical protein